MRLVPTPDWFIGKDVLIESFSFIVLFLFSFLSLKNYKLTKNKKFLYLGFGFSLIALAQLATILTKLVLYYDVGPSQAIGNLVLQKELVGSVDIFYFMGFFFYRLFTLLGLYIIYRLPVKKKSPGDLVLAIYFIAISAFFSRQWSGLFNITALILLVLIINNYYILYKRSKFRNTLILIIAFSILALSQLIFIFASTDLIFVLGNIVELISYGLLLALILRLVQHGKKTKPNGNNIRHARDSSRTGR